MKYLAELIFFHSDFSLTSLLTTDFSLFRTELKKILLNDCKFCSYLEKLGWYESVKWQKAVAINVLSLRIV